MVINTKYNRGDTVYLVVSNGQRRMSSDVQCPCCRGTGEVALFPRTIGKCNVSKSMTIDGHWYYVRCDSGKLVFSRPDSVVRKVTIREIEVLSNRDNLYITYYFDNAGDTREEYVYSTEEEAQAIVDKQNAAAEKNLLEL